MYLWESGSGPAFVQESGSGPVFVHDLSLGRLQRGPGSGAGVRSGIRTLSQPWSSRSAAGCALLNADAARLTVLLEM